MHESSVTEDGFALGAWVIAQRKEQKKGTLTKAQEQRLSKGGLVWDRWDEGFAHFVGYPREKVAYTPPFPHMSHPVSPICPT